MDLPLLLDRVSSTSYIAALPDDARARLLDEVRELVAEAGLAGGFTLPHRTHLYWGPKPAEPRPPHGGSATRAARPGGAAPGPGPCSAGSAWCRRRTCRAR